MERTLPLDSVDSRVVLLIYAFVVGATGIFIALWGGMWVGGSLNGQAWGVTSVTRMAGVTIIAAACCAAAFSNIDDPAARHSALGWFIVAHTVVVAMATIQVFAVWDSALPPPVTWLFFGVIGAWGLLLNGWRLHAGGNPRLSVVDLFSRRAPIERLRSKYEEQIRQAGAQEERARMARDLHDSVKQQIFAIQAAAATAETRLQTDPDGALAAIAQVRSAARDSMAEMDVMLDQLRVTPLANAGLAEALRHLCEATRMRTGVTVECRIGELPRDETMPPGGHLALFRAAQEALSNVARHARASRIDVSLGAKGAGVVLEVVDNGKGFTPDAQSNGMGLRNIQGRASELGGHADIVSRAGNGTTVAVTVPYLKTEPTVYLRKALVPIVTMAAAVLVLCLVTRTALPLLMLLLTASIDFTRYIVAWQRARRLQS